MPDIGLVRVKNLKSKRVYNVSLDRKNTNFKAHEIYNNGTRKYYPFYISGGTIHRKYKSITCLTAKDNLRPRTGISVNVNKGYGFTKYKGIHKLFYYFENEFPNINEIIFCKNGKTEINKNNLYITYHDFAALQSRLRVYYDNSKEDEKVNFRRIFSKILSKHFNKPSTYKYHPGTLTRFFDKYNINNLSLSNSDSELLRKLLISSDLSTEALVSTKKEIDIIYIEEVIKEFEQNLQQKTKSTNLEEKWHQFFKKYTWIFSHVFTFPAVFYKDKFQVGARTLDGDPAKVLDFLYKNKITNNLAIIEIKTHLTDLVQKTAYRAPDIFSIDSDLSGAIVQVLDQKTRLLNNFYNQKGKEDIHSLNSVCLVVAGSTTMLNKKGQKQCFELYRWSNKDVVIIPFDELLEKIKAILNIFKKKPKIK